MFSLQASARSGRKARSIQQRRWGIEDTAGATLVKEEKRGGRGDREQGGGVMGRGGVKGGSDCVPRGFSLRRGRSDGSSAVFFKRSSVQQKQALLHKVCKIMLALYFIIMLEARRENGKVARGRNEPSKSAHANNNENNCHINAAATAISTHNHTSTAITAATHSCICLQNLFWYLNTSVIPSMIKQWRRTSGQYSLGGRIVGCVRVNVPEMN